MYRAILLPESQRDLHRFVWRRKEHGTLKVYRMTRLTFGVSALFFAATMGVKQNAIVNEHSYLRAALAVRDSFCVDDGVIININLCTERDWILKHSVSPYNHFLSRL